MEDSPLVWAPPPMVAKMVGFLVDGEESDGDASISGDHQA